MKVLFYMPFQILQRANGGITLFFKTKEYLERTGVQVDLFDPWKTNFRDYDLIHSFSMESTEMWDFAKANGLKLAVTPISWFGVYATLRSRVKRWVKRKLRSRLHCPLHSYWWEDCFAFPNIFFPQSNLQASQLNVAFGVPPDRCLVVRHGVDERFAHADPGLFVETHKVKNFILCVGRIDPIKNQLSLIRAFKGTNTPMVLIGRPDTARYEWYYEACVREADASVLFLRDVDHDSPLLASCYAAARVLVLPSFMEIPGLAALEAAMAGCSVVVTKVGVAKEYLGNHARYVDPWSVENIRQTVLDAYESGPRPNLALQQHMMNNFRWDTVITGNLEGYRKLLNSPE
jgi:glycosyltransferase involved in cell wall biosynthesis